MTSGGPKWAIEQTLKYLARTQCSMSCAGTGTLQLQADMRRHPPAAPV